MKIRKTAEKDLVRVMEIYAHARRFMAEHGNPDQWGKRNWPPEELIRTDIKEGCSYVCRFLLRQMGIRTMRASEDRYA